MADDFRDLNLDKPTRREMKTSDQISKHTVDGNLESRAVDRALHLLTVGDELQKISVMKNLPSLLKEDLGACIQRVIPRMQQTLPHGTTEYNMGACEAVRAVAKEKEIMPAETFTKMFLQHILTSLESRDTVAADEWLNVLLDIIQVLPTNVLQSEVLPIAVNKAHISKPVAVRITSCKILGRLALSFPPLLVKKDINPVVISLCQDVSGDVRSAMSAELPNVSATLGLETSNYLLNHILDLVSDEDVTVRQASVEAIAQMLPRFSQEVLKNTILPLCKKVFVEIMKNEDALLVVLSRFYGQYCIGLKSVMTPQEKIQFLQRYTQLSQLNLNTRRKLNPYKPIVIDEDELALRLTEIRLNCAFNFPAMVMFSSDMKQDSIDSLFSVFRSLASDSFCEVRRKIAAGFYEVMKMMPKWHLALKGEFIKLLRDDIDIVLEGIVPNVSNILIGFGGSNTLTSDKVDSGKDVGQALFVCEKNLSEALHWRLHEELLRAFRAVPKVFNAEFVYLYFVPLLMTRAMNGRILPCRVAALHTLLVIIVDPTQVKQKLKIRNKILELCNNSSFHCRLLFLRGMSILLTLSPELLKELFFHNITSMADDKVPNIRLMLCKLLPKLKALAVDPVDQKLLASLDACVSSFSGETDKDVLALLRLALNNMDDVDRSKGIKKAVIAQNQDPTSVTQKPSSLKYPTGISTLTDMRSFTSGQSDRGTASFYSVGQQPRSTTGQRNSLGGGGARAQSVGVPTAASGESRSTSLPTPRQRSVAASQTSRDADSKKVASNRLTAEDFMIDAGVTLKSATAPVKRIPTPRPVHRSMAASNVEEFEGQKRLSGKENNRANLTPALTSTRSISSITVKNVSPRPSGLPIKRSSFKPLNSDEIEKELMQSETVRVYSPRLTDRLKYSGKPTKTAKKENNRYSLDVSDMPNMFARMSTRSPNLNKRFSLEVDSSKSFESKKSLSAINNNTLISPKLGSTRSGIVRPQSCILSTEKVNHSKRSMSVENLPPKVTRLTSKLPVRATDPKLSKPK